MSIANQAPEKESEKDRHRVVKSRRKGYCRRIVASSGKGDATLREKELRVLPAEGAWLCVRLLRDHQNAM